MNNLLLEQLVNDLLEVNLFQDYCPNGLQIEGVSEIKKIATAVTASQAIIKQAIDRNVDALFVHHGYFWKGENPCIRGVKKERIALIIQNNMNLYAYHLPLDVYIDFGNNASIAHKLHLTNLVQHASGLLWIGDTKAKMSSQELCLLAQKHYGPQVQYIGPELKNIQKIAFCSGGGQNYFEEAIIKGADVFLSGEYSEKVFHLAHESGVGFVVLGHHASEKDGIQNLGKSLSQKFNLEHIFLDEKNPL